MMSRFLIYIRQAMALMKEDKLFSCIYVAGTAVAIASAMVVAIILNIQLADIYPETNRERILHVKSSFYKEDGSVGRWYGMSPKGVEELFGNLECAEAVSASMDDNLIYDIKACAELGKQEVAIFPKFTDDAFFRIYSFEFVEGKPFSKENMEHDDYCIVITDALAKKMWGDEGEAVGRSLLLNYLPYRVVGVVKEASPLMCASSADVYLPYTVKDSNAQYNNPDNPYSGAMEVRVLLKRGCTRQMLVDELEPHRNRILSELKSTTGIEFGWDIVAKPYWADSILPFFPTKDYSTGSLLLNLLLPALIMLLFLLLPAINLSGMVSNRMESRVAEMGIRKAFGAKKRVLLNQVIQENLVLTLVGGIVGYALSFAVVKAISNTPMFLTFFQRDNDPVDNVSMQFGMFFTPTMFLIAFVCCAVLNLMAALIPAWTSLKRPIVESLNQKK